MRLFVNFLRALVLAAPLALRAHELCRDSNFVITNSTLPFCTAYSGIRSCCDPARDATVEADYDSTTSASTPSTACANVLQKVLCSRCDAWEDHLYEKSSVTGSSPSLCPDFCGSFYQACKSETLVNSPFAPSQTTTIASLFPTQESFCDKFAPVDASYCFTGDPYELPPPVIPDSDYQVCLEHLNNYDNDLVGVVPIPDRLDLIVEFTRGGKIRAISESTGRVATDYGTDGIIATVTLYCPVPTGFSEQGLLSIAFRPDFATSGRFYVYGNVAGSANNGIDTAVQEWHCSDPEQLQGCSSVGLVLQVYQPFANHNGGVVVFAIHDPNVLILTTGDGGSGCDPNGNSQSHTQILGKVLRIKLPAGASAANFNYTIPEDNPFANDTDSRENVRQKPSWVTRRNDKDLPRDLGARFAKSFSVQYRSVRSRREVFNVLRRRR